MNAKFYPFLWCAGSLLEYVFSFFFSGTEACEVLALAVFCLFLKYCTASELFSPFICLIFPFVDTHYV